MAGSKRVYDLPMSDSVKGESMNGSEQQTPFEPRGCKGFATGRTGEGNTYLN